MRHALGHLSQRILVAASLLCALATSCDATSKRRAGATPSSRPSAAHSARAASAELDVGQALTGIARSAANDALSRVRALRSKSLREGCGEVPDYLPLRRAVARGKPWWRRAAVEASEVLLGPERPAVEGGGNLGLLDAALIGADCPAADKAAYQVEHALELILIALDRPMPAEQSVRTLCVMAVDLGGILLESDAEVALAPDGIRADALGTIEGLEQGLAALRARQIDSANAKAAATALGELRSAVERRVLTGRAALVASTGSLGAALRLLARERGFTIKPPYAPRVSTTADPIAEPVSRLTVPAARAPVDAARAALGARLFSDRRLSGDRRQSCATCHVPSRAFSDGLKRPRSRDAEVTLRHTPTLLYAPAQAAQLWDGRVITRQRQALRVLHSTAEMGVTDEQIVQRVSEDAPLRAEVERVFPSGVTVENVVAALADYQESALVPASAPIDEFSRGKGTLSAAASSGLDVFAGSARCARCHVPPLFGGTRPNDFAVTVYAVIGTTTDPSGRKLDEDRGRFAVTGLAADDRAFKTPTLRNVARTAPYFHNGAFPTLESVVDFYDKGGGRAFGHRVDNQDPDVRPLHLTREQRRDLLVFLREALTDRRQNP